MFNKLKSECEICKIFSSPSRVSIILSLKKDSKTVTDIIKETKLSQSVVSQHLSMLRAKKIVEIEKEGSWVTYTLKYPEIIDAFDIMKNVMKKINNIKK